MAYIEAERFAELKARVKAECLRRCHTGSVAEYGGTPPSRAKSIKNIIICVRCFSYISMLSNSSLYGSYMALRILNTRVGAIAS